jgi:ferredoxin
VTLRHTLSTSLASVDADVLAAMPHRVASGEEIVCARTDVDDAAHRMGRQMPDVDLRALLARSRESPQWDEVASRCLTCGNCTMVCPTCFCTRTEDVSDLTGEHTERWRHWASCFELDFTFIHGGGPSVRRIPLPALADP